MTIPTITQIFSPGNFPASTRNQNLKPIRLGSIEQCTDLHFAPVHLEGALHDVISQEPNKKSRGILIKKNFQG